MSTGSRFVLPYQTVIDNAGTPLPGALLFFYASGTDIPLATYADANLTTPNVNPVVADAAGEFPNIFLQGAAYKVVLENSDGVEQWTADPVVGFGANLPGAGYSFDTTTDLLAAFGLGIVLANGTQATTSGRTTVGDDGGALFYYAAGDHATADNGGTVRVDAQGRRWVAILSPTSLTPELFGAKADGIADDAAAFDSAMTVAGQGLTSLSSATYAVSGITTQEASNLIGNSSVLKPTANNQTVVTVDGTLGLQSGQFQLLKDFVIDGAGRTGITGISGTIVSGGTTPYMGAQTILDNITIVNCDGVGFNFGATQFLRTNSLAVAFSASVGMYIVADAAEGGANSHDHYQPQITSNAVGLLVDGTADSTGCNDLNFYDPNILGNTVCGAAFFKANAVAFYGCAPENNGSGAATIVINGKTIKRSSMYLNESIVSVENGFNAEDVVNPCFILENNSVLNLRNAFGYGIATGTLVSADASSTVNLFGSFKSIGTVQNVGAWPDAFYLAGAAQQLLYGQPMLTLDDALSPFYAAQAPLLVASSVTPPTVTSVEDATLGYCRQSVFAASPGSAGTDTNAAKITFPGVAAASQDSLFTALVKASVDCVLGFNFHDGTSFNGINGTINLIAGKATRVVIAKAAIPSGSWTLYFYPSDSAGPTIQFANLQVYQGTTGVASAQADIMKIVRTGGFYPGPTRDTATNIQDKAAAVNGPSKFPGKQIWDSTDARVLFAGGAADTSVWKDGVNSTVYTPA